jgi:hypothetical protein
MTLITIDAKMRLKRSTIPSTVPTIGATQDHADGSWSDEDIYEGEMFFNVPDGKLWIGSDAATVRELAFKDQIVAGADLGSGDLVSANQVRLFQLFGNGINDNLTVVNASLQTVAQFKGDRNTWLAGQNTLIGSGGSHTTLTFGGNQATLYGGNGAYFDSVTGYRHRFYTYGTLNMMQGVGSTWFYTNLILSEGNDIQIGSVTGTKIGHSVNSKIGFWGVTPVKQPTTATTSATIVTGSGNAVLDDDRFDGYTLPQIVKALRNAGILQ